MPDWSSVAWWVDCLIELNPESAEPPLLEPLPPPTAPTSLKKRQLSSRGSLSSYPLAPCRQLSIERVAGIQFPKVPEQQSSKKGRNTKPDALLPWNDHGKGSVRHSFRSTTFSRFPVPRPPGSQRHLGPKMSPHPVNPPSSPMPWPPPSPLCVCSIQLILPHFVPRPASKASRSIRFPQNHHPATLGALRAVSTA